jgi:predicted acetyltransferase
LLGLTLDEARRIGLERVLITADTVNVASWQVIEKNGGALENEVASAATGRLIRRYWIDL